MVVVDVLVTPVVEGDHPAHIVASVDAQRRQEGVQHNGHDSHAQCDQGHKTRNTFFGLFFHVDFLRFLV